MAFGALQRKSSNPQPFRPAMSISRSNALLRKRLKIGGLIAVVMVSLWGILHLFSSPIRRSSPMRVVEEQKTGPAPAGLPDVVLVTALDPTMSAAYVRRIKTNREHYAQRHGYEIFYANASQYDLGKDPPTWALVPAVRHAMTLYPRSTYFFSLSPHALIMNPTLSVQAHIMENSRLESLMLRDKPVVPPDSVIHTFSHLRGGDIDLVLTQDLLGLNPESFIIRQGSWAKFFLDVWFDPMYRTYHFQKAEAHALEHIIQWHPTILTRLALIPQRIMNSYTVDDPRRGGKAVTFQDDDFLVRPVGCELDAGRNCESELEKWYDLWHSQYGKDAKTPAGAI